MKENLSKEANDEKKCVITVYAIGETAMTLAEDCFKKLWITVFNAEKDISMYGNIPVQRYEFAIYSKKYCKCMVDSFNTICRDMMPKEIVKSIQSDKEHTKYVCYLFENPSKSFS